MRLNRLLLIPVAAAAMTALAVGPAAAGEVNGNGEYTPAIDNAQSICVYSGLQDGDDNDDGVPDPGADFGPGFTQNWGHTKQELRAAGVPAEAIAATRPGVTCNGHTGIIASGGGE
jgi:hypothetical protein